MLNIDENMIKDLIQKEIQIQVKKQVDKYCNSIDFKDIVKGEVRYLIGNSFNFTHISNLVEKALKEKNYADTLAQSVADRVFDNFKYAINLDGDDY